MRSILIAVRALAMTAVVFAGAWATGLAQSPSPPSGTGSITGTVTNQVSQGPVANATVELLGTAVDKTTHSDASGNFSFDGLTPGSYSLKTTAHGYTQSTSAPFSVGANEQVTLAVALSPVSGAELRTISSVRVNGKQSVNTTTTPTVTITNRQFIQAGQVLVEQALEQTPGVTLEHYDGGLGSVATISIRGAGGFMQGNNTGYEVLVLQDGEPMRNGQYGDADLSTLTPSIYSRVEVLKGVGGTSLFGANTIGGTLNLVTRDPLATEGGQFIGSLGGFGTYSYDLVETDTIGKFGYIFDIHRLGSDGPVPGSFIADYVTNTYHNDNNGCTTPAACGPFWHPTQTFALNSDLIKLKYQFSPATFLTVSQQGESDMRDQIGLLTNPTNAYNGNGSYFDPLGYPYFYGFPGDSLWNIQPKIGADLHTEIGGGDFLVRSYGGILERVDDGNGEPAALCCYLQRSIDRLYGTEAYWTKLFGNHTVTLAAGGNGDSYFYGSTGSNDTPLNFSDISLTNGKQVERTYMARDDWQIDPRLDMNLTGYYSTYDTLQVKRFDPRLGVVYRPDLSTAVRFSAASGFAPPRLSDLYNPLDNYGGDATYDPRCPQKDGIYNGDCVASTGNPSIKSESAAGLDLGVDHTFGFANRGLVSLDLYRTNLSNHIFYVNLPAPAGTGNFTGKSSPGGSPILFVNTPINLAHAVYAGFEFNGVLPVTHNFSITGLYTTQAAYPTGVDLNTEMVAGDVLNNQQFLGVPVHQASYGLRYDNNAGASAFFRGDDFMQNNAYDLPQFWLYSAGITEPMPSNNSLTFAWQNIFNKNALIFSQFDGGVPYPGAGGPYGETAHPVYPHSVMVTFSHSWGSLTNP